MTKKRKKGRWLEEYKNCCHTYVAAKKSELIGYCSKCGTDRKYAIRLPSATEVGDMNGEEH